jgi:hypothetical protein
MTADLRKRAKAAARKIHVTEASLLRMALVDFIAAIESKHQRPTKGAPTPAA